VLIPLSGAGGGGVHAAWRGRPPALRARPGRVVRRARRDLDRAARL